MKKVNIVPLVYKVNFPPANILTVRISHDDLTSIAHLDWSLMSSVPGTSSFLKKNLAINRLIDVGKIEVAGSDYSEWEGDNDFPITFVAKKLGVTIVK